MKLIKFSAPWCSNCKSLTKIMATVDMGNISVEEVDIDADTESALTYGVRALPTCVLLDENNNEVRRKVGLMNADSFREFISA